MSSWWDIPETSVAENIHCAKKIDIGKKRLFDSSLLALINLGEDSNQVIGKILLMFEHYQFQSKQQLALVHIYQNIHINRGGILFGDVTERGNQDKINSCSVLKLVKIDSLDFTVAAIVSNLKENENVIYFFWPEMKRVDFEIGEYDCFQDDDITNFY